MYRIILFFLIAILLGCQSQDTKTTSPATSTDSTTSTSTATNTGANTTTATDSGTGSGTSAGSNTNSGTSTNTGTSTGTGTSSGGSTQGGSNTGSGSGSTNTAPTASAGSNLSTEVGIEVLLSGNGSDLDGDVLTYHWKLVSIPATSATTLQNADTQAPRFTPDVAGSYVAELVVNDGIIDSSPSSVTISVATGSSSTNTAPTASAGSNLNTEVGIEVVLSGNGSDLDGDVLTYHWKLVSIPATSATTLQNADTQTPRFTPDVEGNYVAELVVNDGVIDSSPSSVTITAAIGNLPPTADAGTNKVVGVTDTVLLDGNNSTDPNGDTLSYTWSFVSIPTGSSAVLSNVHNSAPSFTADVSGEYSVQLIVNDGALNSAADTMTVNAASFSVIVNWPANTDNPSGYVVYVGPTANSVTSLANVLAKGATDWNPSSPSTEIDGGTILNAVGTTGQACFTVKAYNNGGLSAASDATCLTVPLI